MGFSFDTFVEKTFDNFKRITPALVAVALLTGLLLFLPESILNKMGFEDLPPLWKSVIGLFFLLSTVLMVTVMLFSILASCRRKIKYTRFMRNMKKKYLSLNQRQQEIIIELLLSEDKTIILDKNSGDTVYLVQNMFLYQPEQLFIPGFNNEMLLKYVPHPWLLDMFNKEEDLFRPTETD